MTNTQRHPFRTLFAFCFMLILAVGVIGYASGWINFRHEEQKATIEIETSEIKEAAEQAVETGKEFIEKSSEKLSEFTTESVQDKDSLESHDADRSEGAARDLQEEVSTSPSLVAPSPQPDKSS